MSASLPVEVPPSSRVICPPHQALPTSLRSFRCASTRSPMSPSLSGSTGVVSTLAVNFYGLRALSETVAPRLREGGAIVNVASIAYYGWRANLERAKSLA